MSACRIARRVAWRVRSLNPRTGAVSTRTLATKVFDCCCHLFLLRCGRRLRVAALPSPVVSLNNGECSSAGVALFPRQGSTRRVGCSATPPATPFITDSLVTKGKNEDKK